MIWESPGLFWLLLLLPVIFGLNRYLSHRIRTRREHYFSDALFNRLQNHPIPAAIRAREGLFYAGLFFLIIALAGPKIGTEIREIQREQLDLIVAIDLSKSMKAEDVRPNRLEKAKFEISRVLDNLENDRVGLIVFTGHAMLHCPLTTDYSAFRMFLDIADTDIMPSTTTDFNVLFREAVSAFGSSGRNGGSSGRQGAAEPARVLLLFSDGEDHSDQYEASLRELLDMGVYIYTVGVGTEEGGNIRLTDAETERFENYHRDRSGRIVTTRLESEKLREMASMSGGQYYQISRTAHNIEGFIRQLDYLDRSLFASEEITRYQNRYHYPAILSVLCFVISLLLPGYRQPS